MQYKDNQKLSYSLIKNLESSKVGTLKMIINCKMNWYKEVEII